MSNETLHHSKYISYLAYTDTPVEYYTTVSNNETIMFVDKTEDNVQRNLNALTIENVGSATMFVQVLPSNYLLVIPSGESRSLDYVQSTGMTVIGNLGQRVRWCGCWW